MKGLAYFCFIPESDGERDKADELPRACHFDVYASFIIRSFFFVDEQKVWTGM